MLYIQTNILLLLYTAEGENSSCDTKKKGSQSTGTGRPGAHLPSPYYVQPIASPAEGMPSQSRPTPPRPPLTHVQSIVPLPTPSSPTNIAPSSNPNNPIPTPPPISSHWPQPQIEYSLTESHPLVLDASEGTKTPHRGTLFRRVRGSDDVPYCLLLACVGPKSRPQDQRTRQGMECD